MILRNDKTKNCTTSYIIDSIKTPREENGDLNKLSCTLCGNKSGALAILKIQDFWAEPEIKINIHICKGCLSSMVDNINRDILKI